MKKETCLSIVSVYLIAAALLASLLAHSAFAGWKPYSGGPLTPGDFQGPVPDPLPKEDGVEIKSKVTTGIETKNVEYTGQSQGGKVTVTATKVELESGTDPNQSWNSDPCDPNLLKHEQGHADQEEETKKKAQAEIEKLIKEGKLKGEGSTEEEAKKDLQDKIDEIIKKHQDDKQKEYDQKTGHGTKEEEQQKESEQKKKEAETPNTDPEKKLALDARSDGPLEYDPATGLSLDGAAIAYVEPPVPGDPAVGATVSMPHFMLVSETADGRFFFQADPCDSTLSISKGPETFMSCQLDYIVYDPEINTFYGLASLYGSPLPAGYSPYVDGLNTALVSDSLALFGVEVVPAVDLMLATNGFITAAMAPTTATQGMREVGKLPLTCADVWAYGLGMRGDINRDCYVNNEDLALLAENWLKCNNPLDSNCPEF
jgi:hypothetical protein